MALRVRTFTDQAELTLKVPEAVGHFWVQSRPQLRRNRSDPSTPTVSWRGNQNLLISKEIPVEQLAVWGKPNNRTLRKRNSCRIGGTRPQSLFRHWRLWIRNRGRNCWAGRKFPSVHQRAWNRLQSCKIKSPDWRKDCKIAEIIANFAKIVLRSKI